MKTKASRVPSAEEADSRPTLERLLEQKMGDITLLLCNEGNGRSQLYEEVIAMVERSLFKIALERSHHVKSAAAAYLGMNRNTFQSRLGKLGLNGRGGEAADVVSRQSAMKPGMEE
jgi:DNA-binding protein Fis